MTPPAAADGVIVLPGGVTSEPEHISPRRRDCIHGLKRAGSPYPDDII